MNHTNNIRKNKTLFIIALTLLPLSLLAFFLFSGATLTPNPHNHVDFSRVIRDNVAPNTRVVDIAMLGAHNAFTHQINTRSAVAPYNTNPFVNTTTSRIAPGLISRLMLAQKSCVSGLLMYGVRYFDVRITPYNGGWYTHHNLISAPLEAYLTDIIDFLYANPGELIVFDIQHAQLGGRLYSELWEFIADVRSNGLSLFDFVNFDPFNTLLGELTLGQATRYGAAVIILAKTPALPSLFHYEYYTSIRSHWHNRIRTAEMLEDIQGEYDFLSQHFNNFANMFRVNQAQTTPVFSGARNVAATLRGWSLLRHNARHNVELLHHEDFANWLYVMPIFMVDFADSPVGGFHAGVMEIINAHNAKGSEI